MIFKEIRGDLFEEHYRKGDLYVHCISNDWECGKGIAKVFRDKYNMVPTEKMNKQFAEKMLFPVNCVITKNPYVDMYLANLITKKKYYQKPTYKSLENALEYLKNILNYQNVRNDGLRIKRLLMPRIGCGLDRLKWTKVREIIKNIFQDTNLEIEVYFNLPLKN